MNVLNLSPAIFKISYAAGSIAFRTAMISHMATFTRSHRSSSLDKHFQTVSRNCFILRYNISTYIYLYTCITLSTNQGTACSSIFRMFFLSASSRTPWSGDGRVMPGNKSDTMPSNKGKSCDKNWNKNDKTR